MQLHELCATAVITLYSAILVTQENLSRVGSITTITTSGVSSSRSSEHAIHPSPAAETWKHGRCQPVRSRYENRVVPKGKSGRDVLDCGCWVQP